MTEKIKTFISKRDFPYHIFSYILSTIFFSILPIVWFIVFMHENKIFSYDFFTNGMFGLSIFFFFALFLLLVLGFFYVGFISFFIIYLYRKKTHPNTNSGYISIYLFIVNAIMILITFTIKKLNMSTDFYTYIIIFSILTFSYIGIVIAGKGLHKFIILIIFIGFFILSIFQYHYVISTLIETGLLRFRMGGNIQTRIINNKNNKPIVTGSLVLLAPNKVFLRDNNTTKIFNRDNIIVELLE